MSKPRQVILIMTDTQRKDMVSCYGNPDMKTPALDKLASEGIRFNRAYTCQPVCGPARSALFTGMFPHSNGSWGNCMPLGDTVKTVGQRVSGCGVRTAYIGKWHLDGGDYFGMGRCPDGWDPDHWYDMRNYLEELSPEDRLRSRHAKINESDDLTSEFTFGHRCSTRAINYIKDNGDDSFLLVVSYDEPHEPFVCPKPYSQMFKGYEFPKNANIYDTLEDKPEHHQVWSDAMPDVNTESLKIEPAYFLGCNAYIDAQIGRVIEAIDQHAPDALVIYTSDHGAMLYSHGMQGKGPAVYDEITNIPLIVRWRGQAPANTVSDQPMSHIDIVPTILDAFEIQPSKVLEGKSALPVFHDPGVRINDVVFIEFTRYEVDHDKFGGFQPIRACYDGRYKLTINLMVTDELYDIDDDPDEMTNLIDSADHAKIRDGLHDRILRWMNETRDPFRGYYWHRRPWRTDAPAATYTYTGASRQREEDLRYEPRQFDYATGMEMTEGTRGEVAP